MKKLISLALTCFTLITVLIPFGTVFADKGTDTDPCDVTMMRIYLSSLGKDLSTINLTLNSGYYIKENNKRIMSEKISVSHEGTSVVVRNSDGTALYSGNELSICRFNQSRNTGYLTIQENGRSYLGNFRFKLATKDGKTYLQAINHVLTPYYIYGVLAGEMSNTWNVEALKSQAIAAKNYAITDKVNNPKYASINPNYDLNDTSGNQAYKGYDPKNTRIMEAVDTTADLVLMYNNKLIRTYYSSSNGGETSLPSNAWSSSSVNDGYSMQLDHWDFNTGKNRETFKIELNTPLVDQRFATVLKEAAKNQLKTNETFLQIWSVKQVSMSNPAYANSKRNLQDVNVTFSAATSLNEEKDFTVTFPVAKLFEAGIFTSKNFKMYWGESTDNGKAYSIYHVRYGHGVGLSQWAAKYRADAGQSFKDIIDFYYPGCQLVHSSIYLPVDDSSTNGSIAKPEIAVTESDFTNKKRTNGKDDVLTQNNSVLGSVNTQGLKPFLIDKDDTASTQSTNVDSYAYVDKNIAELRSGANGEGVIIDNLSFGDMVTVIERGDYYKIETANQMTGYVEEEALKVLPSSTNTVSYMLGKLNVSSANFRKTPSTSGELLGKVYAGDSFYIWGKATQNDGWYYVQVGLKYGYIFADYVDAGSTYIAMSVTDDSIVASGVTVDEVNLRPKPSTAVTPLMSCDSGTYVLVYSLDSNWYKVQVSGITGYIREDFLNINTSLPIAPSDVAAPVAPKAIGTGTVTANGVRFRTGPATSYDIICNLNKNDKLEIYGEENGWYYGKFNNKVGYVSGQYIDFTPITGDTPTESTLRFSKGIATANVNFRGLATTDSEVIQLLNKGTKFDIIAQTGSWYFIKYNNRYGYVSKQYASINEQGNIDLITVSDSWLPYTAKTNAEVNLRMGADTAYSVISKLNKNVSVTVLAITEQSVYGWCLVEANGVVGFVAYPYLNH